MRERKQMNKKFGASLLAASVPGLIFSISAVPMAMGVDAGMSSEIVTEEECTWKMMNAPSSLALTPAVAGTEYEGVALDISATTTDFDVHSTGNLDTTPALDSHNECTFYGTGNVTRPIVSMAIGDGDFTATYDDSGTATADAGLDFALDADNALDIAWSAGDCDAIWTQSGLNLHATALTGTLVTIPLINDVTDPVADGLAGSNDRCVDDIGFTVTIPANMKPDAPGKTYTWTGPTLTTTLSTSSE